ncbi:MAG: PEP-CTERM sorting domain-containing protein [Planctomycetota bacterium]
MKVTCYLMVLSVSIFATNAATGANLIANGDFELGNTGYNTGFNTSYIYSPTGFPEGTYAVNTNPRNLNTLFADYHDHTTGAGNMLIANGATNPNVTVWEQILFVTPDTSYEFSFWLSTANEYVPSGINPADLEYFINDISLGIISTPEQYGVWIQESNFWYSGASTTATIKIIDTDINGWGNDFALDDISFVPVPEPATLLLLGLGGLATMRRRRA